MDVTPLIRADTKIIQAYKGGIFKVSGQNYPDGIFVLGDRVIPWTIDFDIKSLQDNDFMALVEHAANIDVLLLGTGKTMAMSSHALRIGIKKKYGFMLEAMDTGAACRTYNVLIAEGRRVAAALLPYIA